RVIGLTNLNTPITRLPDYPITRFKVESMRRSSLVSALAAATAPALFACGPGGQAPQTRTTRFDVLITNGRIVDGTGSPWFLGDYFKRLEERSRTTINVATLVGAGGIRNYVIGKDDRPATPAELDRMKQLVAEAMEQGALGLSTSLQYVPDRFASTDEIVELA